MRRITANLTWFALVLAASASEITITSDPDKASVFLDGRFVGVTPVTVAGVREGKHLLELRRHGRDPWKKAVAVRQDGQQFEIALAPVATGRLRVVSRPRGAQVFVDGIARGRTPAEVHGLTVGTYSVRLELDEWLPWRADVTIARGEEEAIDAVLDFSGEAMLLAELEREPHKIVDYYELAHHYALQRDFDRLLDVLARGLDAAVHPDAETDESRRLCDEVDRVCTGQYDFATEEEIELLRPKVVDLLRAAIERVPRNVQAYWVLGKILAREGRDEEALSVYRSALGVVKGERARMYYECAAAGLMYRAAYALEVDRKYTEAMTAYKALVETYPKPWHAATALTRMAVIAGSYLKEPEQALAYKQRLIALFPDSDDCPRLQLETAEALRRQQQDAAGAIEAYRTFLTKYPEDDRCPEAQMRIADILWTDLGEAGRAVDEYRKLLSDYPESRLCSEALAGIAKADPALAGEAHERLVKEYPGSPEAGAVDADEERKARRAEADALLQAISPLAHKAIASGERASRYDALVKRYQARGDTERAERYAKYAERYGAPAMADAEKIMGDCATIVERYPTFYHASEAQRHIIGMYADVYRDLQKANEARRTFLRMFPDDDMAASVRYDLANSIFRDFREHENAVAELKALIRAYPESDLCVRAQALIASIYSHTNGHFDRDRSIEENRRLIETYPDYDGNAEAQTAIGRVYHYRTEPGDDERAAAAYLKVIRDYPYTSSAFAAEYRLDQHKAGLQLAELAAEGKVKLDPETGRRLTD